MFSQKHSYPLCAFNASAISANFFMRDRKMNGPKLTRLTPISCNSTREAVSYDGQLLIMWFPHKALTLVSGGTRRLCGLIVIFLGIIVFTLFWNNSVMLYGFPPNTKVFFCSQDIHLRFFYLWVFCITFHINEL
jgi:hypothetical protein